MIGHHRRRRRDRPARPLSPRRCAFGNIMNCLLNRSLPAEYHGLLVEPLGSRNQPGWLEWSIRGCKSRARRQLSGFRLFYSDRRRTWCC